MLKKVMLVKKTYLGFENPFQKTKLSFNLTRALVPTHLTARAK